MASGGCHAPTSLVLSPSKDAPRVCSSPLPKLRHPLPLVACAIEIGGIEPALEGGFEARPLALDDREPRRVAAAALVDDRLAEDALEAEAEPRRRGARGRVERVAFPLVAAISQLVEDAAHHQIHRLGRGGGALQARAVVYAAPPDDAPGPGQSHQAGPPPRAAPPPPEGSPGERGGAPH